MLCENRILYRLLSSSQMICTMKTTLLFLLSIPLFTLSVSAAERPNFVFIVVDDLGKMDLGFEGSRFYETPNIDSLAKRSMRFDRGYSTCQVCSPSRVSIQSGKTPARTGITNWISSTGSNQPEQWSKNTVLLPARYHQQLALEEVTIAEALKSHGYTTMFAGKWHLGSEGFGPEDQGYDVNHGGNHTGTPQGGYHSPYLNPELSDDEFGAELPIRLGQETAGFIREKAAADVPFFAMLSFYSVHGPIQCSKARFEKFQAKAEAMGLTKRTEPRFVFDRVQEVRQVQDHPIYAGMMASMDESVGIVLDAIDDADVRDNTVVIFTSDNGGVSSGDGFSTSALPMRGGKGRQWEGGIRQPYYIHWPNVTTGGSTDSIATGTDFYPTILEMAGLPAMPKQHQDGISLVPALRNQKMPARPLFWHYPHYGNQGGEPSAMMVDGDWKLIHYFEDGHNELYDITKDLSEQHDVASNNNARVEAMMQQLRAFWKETNALMPSPNPNYNAAEAAVRKSQLKDGNPRREKQHAAFMKADFVPEGGWWDLQNQPKIID